MRVFGRWNFGPEDVDRWDLQRRVSRGVPMGGDLRNASNDKAATFMVRALGDSDGVNLGRLQIIKGWTEVGKWFERVYDLAVSDDRARSSR